MKKVIRKLFRNFTAIEKSMKHRTKQRQTKKRNETVQLARAR